MLATGGNDSLIKIWYLDVRKKRATFTLSHTLTDHGTANVMCVSFAPSGKLLASTAGDKTCRLWDVVSEPIHLILVFLLQNAHFFLISGNWNLLGSRRRTR